MTLQEILRAQGLTDEQVEKVINGMKQNKIFTATEENLDTRYGKLKTDHETTTQQLTEAQKLIEQMKKDAGDNSALQTKITDYESKMTELTAENEKLKVEGALKVALLDAGAKASDLDYLMFKAGSGNHGLAVGEDGKLKGQNDLISGLKTQFPSNFDAPGKKEVEEHKLDKPEEGAGGSAEPKNLAEALQQKYEHGNE